MSEDTLRRQYVELLMDQVRSNRFPSPTMLDRIESAVGDREAAERYVRRLIETLGGERFPSPGMLDRLAGLIDALEPGPS